MAFFNQMTPNAGGFGMGGNPSAFTSPGLDPMTLALLLRMQGAGGMGGMGGGTGMPGMGAPPAAPQLPSPMGGGAGPQSSLPMGGMGGAGGAAGMQQPGGGINLMQLLNSIGGMQGLQKLLPMLGMGGAAAAPFNAFGPGNFGAVNPVGAAAAQGITVR